MQDRWRQDMQVSLLFRLRRHQQHCEWQKRLSADSAMLLILNNCVHAFFQTLIQDNIAGQSTTAAALIAAFDGEGVGDGGDGAGSKLISLGITANTTSTTNTTGGGGAAPASDGGILGAMIEFFVNFEWKSEYSVYASLVSGNTLFIV